MQIAGRRIHIAGSVAPTTDENLIKYAHRLIDLLVSSLADQGATFVVGLGKEPLLLPDEPSSPSIIFDWTVLASAYGSLERGTAPAVGAEGYLIAVPMTSKTENQIPDHRRCLWEDLLAKRAVDLQYIGPGWTSGAVRRIHQARLGDILLALGGGEGVEHLARLYAEAGKPIILLDLPLGSGSTDGSGGAAQLALKALAHPEQFARFSDPRAGSALFRGISTDKGRKPIDTVVKKVLELIEALRPPRAFYVRLLNTDIENYCEVEHFFADIVDPVVRDFGYEPFATDRGVNEHAWMNDAIFDNLHHSAIAIVDLTGMRPNCLMELGYALGRGQRVLITAMSGTRPPFDAQMIERHSWSESEPIEQQRKKFREFWRRNINRPPIVKPRSIL